MDHNYVQVQCRNTDGNDQEGGKLGGWYVYTEESPAEAAELLELWKMLGLPFEADDARIVEMDSDNWI
jgi:hypothetical protein